MTEAVSTASARAAVPRRAAGIGPDGTYTRSGQIAAFVLGVLAMLVCAPLMVAAALLYARAETVFPYDPGRARGLVNRSWICLTAPVLFAAVFGVTYLIATTAT